MTISCLFLKNRNIKYGSSNHWLKYGCFFRLIFTCLSICRYTYHVSRNIGNVSSESICIIQIINILTFSSDSYFIRGNLKISNLKSFHLLLQIIFLVYPRPVQNLKQFKLWILVMNGHKSGHLFLWCFLLWQWSQVLLSYLISTILQQLIRE